jgi:hypothetical protein
MLWESDIGHLPYAYTDYGGSNEDEDEEVVGENHANDSDDDLAWTEDAREVGYR